MTQTLRTSLFTLILLIVFVDSALTQNIYGVVQDEGGEPLPYVSIYIKGSTKGTTSNAEGSYSLKVGPGIYDVVYQFVGYKSVVRTVNIDNSDKLVDVTLIPQSILLKEVVIAADREDPAYAIIRNAIKKRPYFKNQFQSYSCDVYVKGNQKILYAPEKILGVELGDLDGMLDSNRQGIVYLSESVSKLHVDNDNYKEIVTSSKISGDDRGYSFNSAREMEFSFYENTIELQREMVSPIANNALNYYNYKLEGIFQDEDGRFINKIRVIPKRTSDPTFYGTIYIVEDIWNIHSLELGATASSTQIFFIDSLTFNQVYIPIESPDKWTLFSNTIRFKLGALGLKIRGVFTGVYSNYDLSPEFETGFFDAYVHVVEPESNERDSLYWKTVRPVPLSGEEVVDYYRKDSIFEVRNDPIFMDSVDRQDSRFKASALLGGYNYMRRSKQFYYSFSSPLSSINYNTVQGYNFQFNFDGRKYFDEGETRRILFGFDSNYGFSEKKFRLKGHLTYRPSRIDLQEFRISGGSDIVQFNREDPISNSLNTVYTLLNRRNHAKYLGVSNLKLSYRFEPKMGWFVTSSLSWEQRKPLVNNSDISYFNKEKNVFTSNDPLNPISFNPSFEQHEAFIFDVSATIRFKQKYFVYPDRKFSAGSEGPRLRINYTGAFKIAGGDVSYQKIAASLDDEWSLGVGGRLNWYMNGGFFFNKNRVEFRDFRHFMGNEIFIMKNSNYSNKFFHLPYYTYSTSDGYFQLHVQHFFDGYFLDKVPGLSKMGWSIVAGAKYLKSGSLPSYQEFHIGINNIGYKLVRLVRIDGVLSLTDGQRNWGVRMSIGFN